MEIMRQKTHKYPRVARPALTEILPVMTPKRLARFEKRIDRSGGPQACHMWLGSPGPGGYGLFQGCDNYQGFSFLPHRITWALAHNAEPGEAIIRHSCDTPGCCNDKHLLDGTQLDNMRDCAERGRFRFNPSGRPSDIDGAVEANRLRYEERMSVWEIAERLGRHRATVSRWTAPTRNPDYRPR